MTPINVDGGSSASLWSNLSFPIKKNKLKVRANYSFRINDRNALLNGESNATQVISHSPSLRLDITPSDDFTVYLSGSYNVSDTEYDLRADQNQQTRSVSGSVEINSKLFAGFFVSTNFSYERFSNDRFGESVTIPIWDSSIYKFFLEGNQLELRLSLYDALNENQGFNQSAFGNNIRQSSTESLARYVMFSVTYNIRGMKTSVKRDGWW